MKFIRITHLFVLIIAVVVGLSFYSRIRGRYAKIENIEKPHKPKNQTHDVKEGRFSASKNYDPEGVLEPIVVTAKKREYKPIDKSKIEQEWMQRLYSSEFLDENGEAIDEEARLREAKKCANKGYRSCTQLLNQLEGFWQEPVCHEFSGKFGLYIARSNASETYNQVFNYNEQYIFLSDQPVFDEKYLAEMRVRELFDGQYAILLKLKEEGKKILEDTTAKNIGHYACFVVDDVVLTCPNIQAKINRGRMLINLKRAGLEGRENQFFNELCYRPIVRPLPY